jgi:hypothetical protein
MRDRRGWGEDNESKEEQPRACVVMNRAAVNDARAPYFLLAHHRSGSNFLNDLLQSHRCLECFNEPFSMHTGFFLQHDLIEWSGDQYGDPDLHPELAPYGGLREYLRELRDYLMQSTSGRVIGFKDTVLFDKLPWLKAFMPSLKIILLRRNPHAIVSSVLRSRLIDFWAYSQLVPPAFHAIFPAYVSRVQGRDPELAAAEVAAMSVATRYAMAARDLRLFEHREVQLERLLSDPRETLDMLQDFLGVPADDGPLRFLDDRFRSDRGGIFSSYRQRKSVLEGWREHLSPDQIAVIDDVMQCT